MLSERVNPLDMLREFAARFGRARVFSAPGRVNLIGEHTDYNDGFVLPIAIERRTFVVGCPRADRLVSVRSSNTSTEFTFDLDRPAPQRHGHWLDYVEGTAQVMMSRGFRLRGAELLISSDVPVGAGLSSSAALEIATGYALASLSSGEPVDRMALALSAQSAEHRYVGTRCGIMDQFIATFAEADSALLIDCRSLARHAVPFSLGSACLLICDTRVKHELASSAYNERRAQCEIAVAMLRAARPSVSSLRDVTWEQFEAAESGLPDLILRRARHVISENARTLRAFADLKAGRLADFGRLMLASHRSLKEDFEVSSDEQDEAVDAAMSAPRVYGSRMTGGGFGGCTITLLEQDAVAAASAAISARLEARFGTNVDLFSSVACAGVHEHTL
jgi:galactokinase